MVSGRFLFAMWGGGGNVPPILAVARRLTSRGHRVRVLAGPSVTRGTPMVADDLARIESAGCGVVPFEQPEEHSAVAGGRGLVLGWIPQSFSPAAFVPRLYGP